MSRLRSMFVASLLLVGMSACASLGALSTALDVVGTVAGQPANPSSDQTAVAVQAEAGVGDVVVMRGTQGLIVANNAYQGAAAIAETGIRARTAIGRPPSAAELRRVRELNDRALLLLDRGEGGLTVAQRAAEVLNIVAELNLFGGRR